VSQLPEYVAIDLETTGIDSKAERITEVGCVRFDTEGPIDRFSTFIDPGIGIPYRIRLLTNIEQDDVQGAPSIASVRDSLEEFLGDRPVVGQNISFDLNFLAAAGITPGGPALDTFELGTLVLPTLPNHSLRSMAAHFGIEFPVQHRALPDAEAAMQVFLALRKHAAGLPPDVLAELGRLAEIAKWPLGRLFEELADEAGGWGAERALRPAWLIPPSRPEALARRDEVLHVPPRLVDAALSPDRAATAIPDFEERREQAIMAKAVARTLSEGDNLVVEAGTGVGKSIAYLLPAATFALRNDARVVVSTDTISLQEQLLQNDVPIVQRMLAAAGVDGDLRATQLKGRRNYVCLKRWSSLRRSGHLSPEEARLLARLLIWLPQTQTGDRSELNLGQTEDRAWGRVSADEENCLGTNCPFVLDGTCFLLRSRQRAEEAHLVVVNHALLLSDVAADGRVIPGYQELIVDEAHNLEDEATRILGFQAGQSEFDAALDRVQTPATEGSLAIVAALRMAVRVSPDPGRLALRLDPLVADVESDAVRCRLDTAGLFEAVSSFMRLQLGALDRNRVSENRLLLTKAVRSQPDWFQVEVAWGTLADSLAKLGTGLGQLVDRLSDLETGDLVEVDELHTMAARAGLEIQDLRRHAADILDRHRPGLIAWLDASKNLDKVEMASAPLEVNETLAERLFTRKRSVVLTGATLSTEGSCDYLRGRLGLEEASELILGSPFDFERSTQMLVPTDLPEPSQPNYQKGIERAVIDLVRASQGRALVLLTSNSAVKATRNGIRHELEESKILVLGQGIDGSPRQLLQTLMSNPRTVILGSASFWEGVDITGEALSLLLMARLPFPVPTEPVYAARAELFDDPFSEYALPQAVLRFRQGFGRLIRRKTDRGVFAVLDRRITTREYGQAFFGSVPRMHVVQEPLAALPARVERWLAPR
jgi:DNA polymerase-3 subunit epsilon/ATP-dependent DNA helicase DinG